MHYNAFMSKHSETRPVIRSTTILCVRRESEVAMAGDGQVSFNDTVAKANAVKVLKLEDMGIENAGVLVGFAGGAADAMALRERFEQRLKESPQNIKRAAVDLAKQWRMDRAMRRLEAIIVVADRSTTLMVSGTGDVIEPTDGIIGIGSGGNFALSAARALVCHTNQTPKQICENAMTVAGELCIYSNTNITLLTL